MARRINLYRRSFREYAQRLKQNAGDEKLQLGWLKDDEVAVLSFHEVAYEKSFYIDCHRDFDPDHCTACPIYISFRPFLEI